jgi:glycosyltransferase involved in cell wall biosynthesis
MNEYLNNIKRTLLHKEETIASPLVSIIMPLYNYSKYVLASINSIVKQSYENWELIIVDDCSTDDSYAIVSSYIKTFPELNITLFQNAENRHVSYTRNYGISKAKGKYIATLDADDLYHTELLKEFVYIAESRRADLVYCSAIMFDDLNMASIERVSYLQDKEPYNRIIPPMQMFVRREVFDVLKYDENKHNGEDTELCMRIFQRGFRNPVQICKSLFYYRWHNSSLSKVTPQQEASNLAHVVIDNPELYSEYHIKWAKQLIAGEDVSMLEHPYTLVPGLVQLIVEYEKDNSNYASILQQIEEKFVQMVEKAKAEKSYRLEIFTIEISENKKIDVLPFWYTYSYGDNHSLMGVLTSEYKVENTDLKRSASLSNFSYVVKVHFNDFKKCIDNGEELISIVVPIRNNAKNLLEETILSVINSSYKNWEMIIVDDCSDDNSQKVATELCKKYQKYQINLYANQFAYGVNITCNAAIKRSNGNYFVPLYSGDVISPSFLERCMTEMKNNNADIVYNAECEKDVLLEKLLLEINTKFGILFTRNVWDNIEGFSETEVSENNYMKLLNSYKRFNFVYYRISEQLYKHRMEK